MHSLLYKYAEVQSVQFVAVTEQVKHWLSQEQMLKSITIATVPVGQFPARTQIWFSESK